MNMEMNKVKNSFDVSGQTTKKWPQIVAGLAAAGGKKIVYFGLVAIEMSENILRRFRGWSCTWMACIGFIPTRRRRRSLLSHLTGSVRSRCVYHHHRSCHFLPTDRIPHEELRPEADDAEPRRAVHDRMDAGHVGSQLDDASYRSLYYRTRWRSILRISSAVLG